jgi:phenylalanyl-tRNA synthetase beta chain
MLRHLHIEDVQWLPVDAPLFHPGRAAMLRAGGVDLGVVGEIHPRVLAEWDITAERVAAWDIDVEALIKALPRRVLYRAISPYQPERQDMAFVVDENVPSATVAQAIRRAGGSAVADVYLFDVYRSEQLGEGRKSLAFGVTLSSAEKPLTEEDAARIRNRIEGALSRGLGASLRS